MGRFEQVTASKMPRGLLMVDVIFFHKLTESNFYMKKFLFLQYQIQINSNFCELVEYIAV